MDTDLELTNLTVNFCDIGGLFNVTNEELTDKHYSMSYTVLLLWMFVFISMIITAVTGNCIVIWVVMAHRRMRNVTNYFLVNLSVADLLLSTLNCFFNFIYMLLGDWKFGLTYCTVNNFIANVTVTASVFTLTAITWDRYIAIVHPLQPRMSRTVSILIIVGVWLASMLLGFPCLLYSTTITYESTYSKKISCLMMWPDGLPNESKLDFIYNLLFLIITYVIPMVLMISWYTIMGGILWGSKTIGEQTQRQLEAIKSKRKVVKMFIFVVIVFGVCWLPYHLYFIYTHIDSRVVYYKYIQHVYLGFYWFAMGNAMVNPLIYYFMNSRFRQYYKAVLCSCWRMYRRHTSDDRQTTLQSSNIKTGRENIRLSTYRRAQSQRTQPQQKYAKTKPIVHSIC